jgi:hypothetical protein
MTVIILTRLLSVLPPLEADVSCTCIFVPNSYDLVSHLLKVASFVKQLNLERDAVWYMP